MADIFKEIESDGHVKQSGWQYHYSSLSKIKDECSKFGTLSRQGGKSSLDYLKAYLNHVYSFAQNILCFYPKETEDLKTNEYVALVQKVNTYITDINEGYESASLIPEDLVLEIAKYFNSLMRLAKTAGLLVDQEDVSTKEPGKGLIGLR